MNIGFIATRLAGTDGVSLEVEKWARVLQQMGHEVFFCAGELGGYAAGGVLLQKLHFTHDHIHSLTRRAFEEQGQDAQSLVDEIYAAADELRAPLRNFIRGHHLDLIIVQNALAIPMNLPLGICLTGLIAEMGIRTIAHNHDFYWERERYQSNSILELLDTAFPADLPNIRHVVINTIAQNRLKARRGIDSVIIPNVFDFEHPPPAPDEYAGDVREKFGLSDDAPFILQPTRVVRRKGIELALELVKRLDLEDPSLFITHSAADEGLRYWQWLQREAEAMGVRLRLTEHLFHTERKRANGHKLYTLWDVYPHADLITFPSLYEGFGNALLEAVYFKRPAVVNRYPVYNADIKPLGFDFIELDGFVDEDAVRRARAALADPQAVHAAVNGNYEIAREHFSLAVLENKLRNLLSEF